MTAKGKEHFYNIPYPMGTRKFISHIKCTTRRVLKYIMGFGNMTLVTDIPSPNRSFHEVEIGIKNISDSHFYSSGEWCEAFIVSEGVVALAIGDICDRAEIPFREKAKIRQVLRESAGKKMSTARTLAEINDFIYRNSLNVSVSVIFALLDVKRNELTFSNAGHPPPLMTGGYGQQFLDFSNGDMPLGINISCLPDIQVVSIPVDSLIVFYTDGINESHRDIAIGQGSLRHAARLAYENKDFCAASFIAKNMSLAGTHYDETTMLTARIGASDM